MAGFGPDSTHHLAFAGSVEGSIVASESPRSDSNKQLNLKWLGGTKKPHKEKYSMAL